MRVDSSEDVVGLWMFDERGRVLGEVIAIVHHWDGRTSALVHSGDLRSGTGRLVSLDGAAIVDGSVHLVGTPARPTALRASLRRRSG
ncbi:MAG: hypothetical protein E6I76_18575 [Chloroflexi bacterium]|nr:MAG: hypothetical protein E6I76_18575 [Chloroflexota bacterium]